MAVVLAVLAVAVMAAALRVSQDRLDYQVLTAHTDQTVAIRGGELSVGNVRVGTRLTREGAVTNETPGIYVVVEVRLAATGNRDVSLDGGKLATRDGFTYKPFESTSIRAISGFRSVDDVVYEVDPAHVDDLTQEIWESELVAGYQQRCRIHLGITPGNADQWRAAAVDRRVEPRTEPTTEALT